MRDLVKRISAFVASVAFTAAMSFTVSAANITAQYDKETDNGKATLSGVKTTGRSQTMVVLSEDSSSVAFDKIVWLNQKDDGTAFDSFYLPLGTYADLAEGETVTYYVRIGGSDGTIQTTEITIAKEATTTPTPEVTATPEPTKAPVEEPTDEPLPEETEAPTATLTPEPTATPVPEATATPMPETTATPAPESTETPAEPDVKCKFTVDEEAAEVSAVISNTYDDDKKVVIAVAQYDDKGVLVSIKFDEITAPGKTAEQYTVKADAVSEKKNRIKGFVWDGISSMKPIAQIEK